MVWHIVKTMLLAVGFDVEERATALQPETSLVRALDLVADVHVLVDKAAVELQALEDGCHVLATGEPEGALHATGVDRAGSHPLFDGDGGVVEVARIEMDGREAGPVVHVGGDHVLPGELGKLAPRQVLRVVAFVIASSRPWAPRQRSYKAL